MEQKIANQEHDMQWLKGRWWYRLLKVLYSLLFLVAILVSALVVSFGYDSRKELDTAKTMVSCGPSDTVMFSLQDAGYTTYARYRYTPDDVMLKEQCYEVKIEQLTRSETLKWSVAKAESFVRNLDFRPGYPAVRTNSYELSAYGWFRVVGFGIVTVIILLILLIALAKAFHYIAVGKKII